MKKKLKARVLLVDDEKEFIGTLSDRLEVRGLKVSCATDGFKALDLIDNQDFDVIVLDLAMPGMDGLETLKKIKNKDPDAEIIMLSGHGTLKSGVEAMRLGAEDFLEKPVDLNDLLEKISEATDKRILLRKKQSKAEIASILKSKGW